MSFYQNTKKDFWNSLDSSVEPIACPCCGSHMSLQFSASYRLKLTREASVFLNQQLSFYRQTLQTIEKALQRHNSPAFENSAKASSYKIDESLLAFTGLYETSSANYLRDYLKDLDIEHFDDIIKKYPLLSVDEASEDKRKITAQPLLQLLQPPHLSCGLIDVTFDQPFVENILTQEIKPVEFLERLRNEKGSSNNGKLDMIFKKLNREFPCILSYCKTIEYSSNGGEKNSLLRIIAILIVFFGDTEGEKEYLNPIPKFTFGAYSQFRNWSTLEKCLTSYFYVSSLQGVFPKYARFMQDNSNSFVDKSNEIEADSYKFVLGSTNNIENLRVLISTVPEFQEVLLYTVDFACAGSVVSIPEDAKIAIRQNNTRVDTTIAEQIKNTIEAEVCGWVPKKQNTESLLLVGGTASSKTTLLQSTIIQVKRASANLGMEFKTCSPLSNLLLQYYEQQYDSGNWKGATENGCRTSIQISLQQSDSPDIVTYLVINDIAGERFEEMLRIEKDYDEIQSPLTKSNNILFLFDLIAWRQLSALLKEFPNNSPNWERLETERAKQETVGRAIADSHDLLIKLIDRVKSASPMSEKKLIDRTFILAIPKCDLYIGEDMFLKGWVEKLTKEGYLKRLGNETDSPYMSTWKFPDHLKQKDNESIFNIALNGISKMSELAADAIKEMSKSQKDEEACFISAERVAQKINSTLTYLENTFEDVKIVPVSALGGMPAQNDNPSGDFKAKAVPLFCEALLLLPMIKMCATETVQSHKNKVEMTFAEN